MTNSLTGANNEPQPNNTSQEKSSRTENSLPQLPNIYLGCFFIICSIYLFLQFQITLNPHQTQFDKHIEESASGRDNITFASRIRKLFSTSITDKDREESDAYKYEHEKGGDRKLRIITSYVYLTLSIICFIQGCLLFSLHFLKKDNTILNKEVFQKLAKVSLCIFIVLLLVWFYLFFYYKKDNVIGYIMAGVIILIIALVVSLSGVFNYHKSSLNGEIISMIISFVLLFIGISYIFYYKYNSSYTDRANEDFEKEQLEENCRNEGINIIYENCIDGGIYKTYNNCISRERLKLTNMCEINYQKYKSLDDSLDIKIKNEYTKYLKDIVEDFNCDKFVNKQLEHSPTAQLCSKTAYDNFKKNNNQKHKDCLEAAKNQSTYNGTIYSKENTEGTTFSTCADKQKFYDKLDESVIIADFKKRGTTNTNVATETSTDTNVITVTETSIRTNK